MRNALTIARFEAVTRLKRISTWVYFAVFAALAIFWTAAAGGVIPHAIVSFGSGKVWINSPFAIAQTVSVLGLFGLTVIAAIMGRAVQQDFEYRVEHFFFSAPIRKWEYLSGRFAGAIVVLLIILSSIALGSIFGLLLPGLDQDRIGPVRPIAYILPYFTVVLPNLVVLGGLFFCLAALKRRMLPVYIASILCLVGFLAAQGLLRDMTNKTLASMLDPFGVVATSQVAAYWSISERNTRLVPFDGVLLGNRLLWLAIGVSAIAFTIWRFRMAQAGVAGRGGRAPALQDADDDVVAVQLRRVAPSAVSGLRLLPRLVFLNFRETVKNIYFGVIAFAGVLFLITTSSTAGSFLGTGIWPVTWQMLEFLSGTFSVFMLVIITFYAGELTWRERESRLDQIHDALPIPTWLPFLGKLLALMLVPVVLQAMLMLCGLGIQTSKGYHNYELGLYMKGLFSIELIDYWLICVLAMAVHSLVNQKYLGHFIMIVYFIAISFASLLGFEHNLYKYGVTPPYVYSDMNGFGHFLIRVRVFQAYWASAALLLAIAAYLFWVRGTTAGWRDRMVGARHRFTRPVGRLAGAGAIAMAGFGAFIFYNTNILNHYQTADDLLAQQANYEKQYKSLAGVPQPKITAVKLAVDLYPAEQQVRMRGSYTLVNKTGNAIDAVHLLFFANDLVVNKLEFGIPAELVVNDVPIGLRSYKLATPLLAGAKTELTFDLATGAHGFRNSGAFTDVEFNGSFINGKMLLPIVGYQKQGEIAADRERKKFDLPPSERMRDRDDPAGLAENYIANDADFITFATTIGTQSDQIAIAPGYLQREWTQDGRRYFEYKMDSPILNFFAFQSGRYAVKKDRWNDVAIEVYYQPGHEYNLDRMIAATKAGLDYYTANFGTYQHKQFRIIEFPRYERFAQAFPNTVPYSEAIGFIARVRDDDKDDIDYPYYVTAHELAHQWWAYQIVPGNVQGGTMLAETLAQYSALMVMKHKYGEEKMQRFLQFELDRYLLGRSTEQKKELPLSRVENQDYIHYRKGSLVMYALQDYIGEDNLNRAIRAFRDEHAFKGPPYPNTTQLLAHIRAVTPPQFQYVVDDMFETITLYDNRAIGAKAKLLQDGRYEVTLKIMAKKYRADDLGKESETPLADWIDIGVVDADNKPLYLAKKKIDHEEMEFTVIVDKKPVRAGIDPYNKLIDRRPKDNTIAIEIP